MMKSMRSPGGFMALKMQAGHAVTLGRILLLGVFVTMLVSTSVSIAFEFASYLAFALVPELRRRFVGILTHPLAIALLPFALILVVATLYGPASWRDALGALFGWRRILLLPLALAVFDDGASKRMLLKVALVTCMVGTLASLFTAAAGIPLTRGPGIIFHNYATQGMTLSIGIVICVAALLRQDAYAGDALLGHRWILVAAIALMVLDIVFVLPGRSGYVSVLVMGAAITALLAKGSWRVKAAAAAAVLLCLAAALALSESGRGRIAQAVQEIATVDQTVEGTSLGVRVVMWRNTVRMVRDHPIFGVGTGGFQDGYRPYVQGVSGWHGHETGDPHNQFLKILGEQGLVGLAALLFFIVGVFRCPGADPYRQIAIALLLGWCATSLANSHFSTFVEGRLLFFWLGALLAGWPGPNRESLDNDTFPAHVQRASTAG